MRLINAVTQDMKFQYRYGFYLAYIVTAIIYILILNFLPSGYKRTFLAFIVVTDTSMLGMFFIGAIVLLEREMGIFKTCFVSPFTLGEYLLSKLTSFFILSATITTIIVLASRVEVVSYIYLVINLVYSIAFFTLLGFVVASKVKSINAYMIKISAYAFVFVLPFLKYILGVETWLYYLIPTKGTIVLLEYSLGYSLEFWQVIYSLIYYPISIYLVFLWAKKRGEIYVVSGGVSGD